MFRILSIIILSIVMIGCTPRRTVDHTPKFSPRLKQVWEQYISVVQEGMKQKGEAAPLMLLREEMTKLYFQHRDQYSDFPDELALRIARTLNQLDQYYALRQPITSTDPPQQSIDLLPRRVVEAPVFMGTIDDGETVYLKLRLRKKPFKWPMRGGEVTSPYGVRKDPFTGALRFHHGIDLGVSTGTPVYAASSGKVLYAGENGGYGLTVVIQHSLKIITLYAHLQRIDVREGMVLKGYDQIGTVGSTGRSTGPHLHFEVRRGRRAIDPVFFIQYQGK